jgi:DNA adenine methylase
MSHFYHVGPQESLRNEMIEIVILSTRAAAPPIAGESKQSVLTLFDAAELADV